MMHLVLLSDGGELQMDPASLGEEMAGEIILVEPLHDQDNCACYLVVEPLENILIEPAVDVIALDVGLARRRLQGIVDNDQTGTASGDWPARRDGQPVSPRCGGKILRSRVLCREPGLRE
jgi:hypothetical protein